MRYLVTSLCFALAIILLSGCSILFEQQNCQSSGDCADGLVCDPLLWMCVSPCTPGKKWCDGTCVDVSRDNAHCGACGQACAAGTNCNGAGICELSCPIGQILCGAQCVDPLTDNRYCGADGQCSEFVECTAGTVCNGAGMCAATCQLGFAECDDACADTSLDPEHCGACGVVCDVGEICVSGICGCPPGLVECNGRCEAAPASDCAPFLTALSVSGPGAAVIDFDPVQTSYTVDVPVSQQDVRVTAVADNPAVTIMVASVAVDSGMPSAPVALALGSNVIDVRVENPDGAWRIYQIDVRRGAQIAQHAYGKASNTGVADLFGYSVSVSGDTLAVGALEEDSRATGVGGDQDDNTARNSGAVYVFRRTGTGWAQEAYLKASNTDAGDYFGSSVAVSGDTLAVGAILEESGATGVGGDQGDNSAWGSGAVYVFRRTGTGWEQEAYVKASNTDAEDYFGYSVAVSGDTLAVGAFLEESGATGVGGDQDDNSAADSGAVYVFRRTGTGWAQEAYLKASNTGAFDNFGESVALSGDTLAVGAEGEGSRATGVGGDQDDNSAWGSGAVYVFRRTGAEWEQEAYVKAFNTDAADCFGYSVAVSGNTLAVGAPREDSGATGVGGDQDDDAAADSGAVYIFH